ncbi:MAG: alginate lyase family protein [Opitutales bacterium]|nr:alginate lyase family protein [Opitutales bacterium]
MEDSQLSHFRKANRLFRENKLREAVKEYEKSLAQNEVYCVYENLGMALEALGLQKEAEKVYTSALRLNAQAARAKRFFSRDDAPTPPRPRPREEQPLPKKTRAAAPVAAKHLPEELKVLYAHKCPFEERLRASYEQSSLSRETDNFVLYRIIGNDLFPRHAIGQSRQNVRFILENEPSLENCEKRWVLNRIFDPAERQAIIDLLEEHDQPYLEIPFEAEAFAAIGWDYSSFPEPGFLSSATFHGLGYEQQERVITATYRLKNLYLMNNNGARNTALEDGRGRAKWVLPWDGNCFVTRSGWEAIQSAVRSAPHLPYFAVPMERITDNAELLRKDFTPCPVEEPQLLFRKDTEDRFGGNHPYGRRPKVELFWRLGIPGKWDRWKDDPWEQPRSEPSAQKEAWGVAGWVARLASGKAHLEAANAESFKKRGLERQIAIRAAINHVTMKVAAQPDPLGFTCYHFQSIQALRENHQSKGASESQNTLVATILANAKDALTRSPESPTDKPEPGPSGILQDYYHPAPYWWPNPKSKNGLPYIRKDGERVPGTKMYEPESNRYDRTRLQRLFEDATTLSLAAFITGDPSFSAHATRWIDRWFLNPDTRMNPHLTYAQIRWGRNQNRGFQTGVIETKDFYFFLDAVRLLHHIGAITDEMLLGIRSWMRDFLEWLLSSEQGSKEAQARNNHGTYYDLQVAAIAAFLEDYETLFMTLARAEERIPLQITPEGVQHEEMTRTMTAHYSCFTLQGWLNLLNLASRFDSTFPARAAAPHHPARMAVQWLLAHQGAPWPHTQIEAFDDRRFLPIKGLAQALGLADQSVGEDLSKINACFDPHDGVQIYWPLSVVGKPTEYTSAKLPTVTKLEKQPDPLLVFAIPIIAKALTNDWELISKNLDNTLASIVNQTDHRWLALIIYHDLPASRYLSHPKIHWLQATFPFPTSAEQGSLDKNQKRRQAAAWLKGQNYDGVYFFPLDADDWVERTLARYVLEDNNRKGYLVSRGYVVDQSSRLAFQRDKEETKGFDQYCGSCFIAWFENAELPTKYSDREAVFSQCISGAHHQYAARSKAFGKDVKEIDFPAIGYLVNHSESLYSKKREGKVRRYRDGSRGWLAVAGGVASIADRFGQNPEEWPAPDPEVATVTKGGTEKGKAEPHPQQQSAWSAEDISDRPWMPQKARKHLAERLKGVSVFLEYGAGGSSVLAASSGIKRIYSVESDKTFLDAVAMKLLDAGFTGEYISIPVDIGPTRNLGKPIDETGRDSWPNYAEAVWNQIESDGEHPRLVLVDGRFRVACFLTSLLKAPAGTVILFDDYLNRRDRYGCVENFISINAEIGRMAEFIVPHELDRLSIETARREFLFDFR